MIKKSKVYSIVVALVSTLAGCATNEQGQLVVDPERMNAVIVSALTPPPPPVVVEEGYVPAPSDIYISNVAERDVVFEGGETYIWVVGPDGRRQRRFYGHGDKRQEVFHRRDDLHAIMARHEGHLPERPVGPHDANGRPGMNRPAVAGQPHPTPGAVQPSRAVAASKPAPASKPVRGKDLKKS